MMGSNFRFSRMVRPAVLVLSALVLSACSLWKGGAERPKPAELGPNIPVLAVRQAWTTRIGSTAGLPLQVNVQAGSVVLASSDGTVASLDAKTGADIWRAKLPERLAAGVGSDGRWAAVVSRENDLIVMESGRVLWRHRLPAQVFTAPLVAGERIFVLAADRSLSAFDAANGTSLWTQPGTGAPLVLRQSGVLLAVGDTLVVGMGGRLVGVNPNSGAVLWDAPLANPRGTNDVERLVELVAPVARSQSRLCARAFQASVACVDLAGGRVDWAQKAYGGTGISGDDSVVFGAESNGTVVAWNRADGMRLWVSERLRYRHLSAPLLLGRSVVVGDDTGWVHFLSREDASPLNRIGTDGSAIDVAPVAAADTLVVVTRSGSVFGFRPD
ncbi:MAG: outer membrane protein assembly factor BamB [Simplicispira suum]|uniref:Outer membrane protein assembly factor BamB n=2 Tax=Simplicispira suum TaxID=2109915 RepID=A0A2S0N2I1_9BURK|nr:outer membrane protein assembly factor BamB [Simplicispira suum]MBW7831660.1 outer membrane protein assembly factor BamB [Simplicispira suum]